MIIIDLVFGLVVLGPVSALVLMATFLPSLVCYLR